MKTYLYILIFIAGFSFTSFSQNRPNESTAKLIKVYPIPATSVVYFDFQGGYDRSYKFEVYSFIGKKVFELANLSQRIALPLDEFFRGFYYYKLLDKYGKFIESGRFIVVK